MQCSGGPKKVAFPPPLANFAGTALSCKAKCGAHLFLAGDTLVAKGVPQGHTVNFVYLEPCHHTRDSDT